MLKDKEIITKASDFKMRKIALILPIILFLYVSFAPVAAFASIAVGVKEGDWIEYTVSYIGNPPEGHDVTWAKMEILGVKEANITIRTTSEFSDQRQENQTTILNLETGHLIDAFIIPANLKTGDTFLDENKGRVTISGEQQKTIAGTERTVVYVVTTETTTYWDKLTGVAVEGNATFDDFTMTTIAETTNLWEPTVASPGSLLISILIIAALASLLLLVALFFRRRRK